MTIAITPQDLENLLKESEKIASDWDAYLAFCQKRNPLLKSFLSVGDMKN